MTGFGEVHPLPGIWDSLHLDSAITLPYGAYALRAWLSASTTVNPAARRFACWSAIASLLLGMAGQIAYHLLTQAGTARAPWAITTAVSCLPFLVLGMGTALAHLLHAQPASNHDPAPTPRPATDLAMEHPGLRCGSRRVGVAAAAWLPFVLARQQPTRTHQRFHANATIPDEHGCKTVGYVFVSRAYIPVCARGPPVSRGWQGEAARRAAHGQRAEPRGLVGHRPHGEHRGRGPGRSWRHTAGE